MDIYTAVYLAPEGVREVASHIASLNARKTQKSKQVIMGAEPPGRARLERARHAWHLLRGGPQHSDACVVALEDVEGREVLVLALRDQRERASAAYYLLTPGTAASEFAARLERAASVADKLPAGSPFQNVA